MPPELAPFLAKAQNQLAEATEGLKPDEAVHHLETTVAEAEAEASRLGIPLVAGVDVTPSGVTIADTDDGAVLVIKQMAEHN